jgi:predicted PurR-regulated permease PerM
MAKNAGERFGDVLFYGMILLLVYLVYRIFEPFLMPLGWAAVFAVIFYSLNKRLEQRWGRNLSAALSTAGVMLILIVRVSTAGSTARGAGLPHMLRHRPT